MFYKILAKPIRNVKIWNADVIVKNEAITPNFACVNILSYATSMQNLDWVIRVIGWPEQKLEGWWKYPPSSPQFWVALKSPVWIWIG